MVRRSDDCCELHVDASVLQSTDNERQPEVRDFDCNIQHFMIRSFKFDSRLSVERWLFRFQTVILTPSCGKWNTACDMEKLYRPIIARCN